MRSFAGGIIGETSFWTDTNERGQDGDIFDIFDNIPHVTSYFCWKNWVMERKKRGVILQHDMCSNVLQP